MFAIAEGVINAVGRKRCEERVVMGQGEHCKRTQRHGLEELTVSGTLKTVKSDLKRTATELSSSGNRVQEYHYIIHSNDEL